MDVSRPEKACKWGKGGGGFDAEIAFPKYLLIIEKTVFARVIYVLNIV